MALHALVGSIAPGQAGVAPPGGTEEIIANIAIWAIVVFVFEFLVTLLIGAALLFVSTPYVQDIERHARGRTLRSWGIGVGALVGGPFVILLAMFVIAILGAIGLPDPVVFLLLLPLLGYFVFVYVAGTVGAIIVGAAVLRRRGPAPNYWLALVGGALLVSLLAVVPLVNILVLLVVVGLGGGAMIDRWWGGRGGDPAESGPQEGYPDRL